MWKRTMFGFLFAAFAKTSAWSTRSVTRSSISRGPQETQMPFRLMMTGEENNEADNKAGPNKRPNKGRFGPLGGRKKRNQVKKQDKENNEKNKIGFWGVAVATVLLLNSIFGWRNDPVSFVYYESSVYESRVYNSDGNVETSRKESFRSNIPSLVEQQQQQRQQGQSSLLFSPEDSLMEDIDRAMRIQDAILDEFF